MSIIHAIFENGVFRPVERVNLPEQCHVEFEPRVVANGEPRRDAMQAVYSVLAQRFESGESDVAARHNEHQP